MRTNEGKGKGREGRAFWHSQSLLILCTMYFSSLALRTSPQPKFNRVAQSRSVNVTKGSQSRFTRSKQPLAMPTLHARPIRLSSFHLFICSYSSLLKFPKIIASWLCNPIKQHPITCQIFDNSNIIIFPSHLSFLITYLRYFHHNSFFDLFTETDVMQIGLRASLSYEKVASTRDTRLPAIISCLIGSPPPSSFER